MRPVPTKSSSLPVHPYKAVAGENPSHGGMLLVLEADASDVEASPLDMLIPEPSVKYTVHFDDVWVPVENRIGQEDASFSRVFSAINPERVVTAALVVVFGRIVLDRAADYASEIYSTPPMGSYQAVQHPLVSAKVSLNRPRSPVRLPRPHTRRNGQPPWPPRTLRNTPPRRP